MAKEIIIDNNFVRPYFAKKKGVHYLAALDIYHHMSFHADGFFLKLNQDQVTTNDIDTQNPYFGRLIDQTRPSESEKIKAYRRAVYLPKTKRPYYKVFSSLRKIVKSQDWKIDYTNADKPKSGVADGEYLEDYCEKKYPFFNSLENWVYNYALNFMLTDPNGLMVVMPTEFEDAEPSEIKENEYLTPYTYLIPSKHVYDYKEGKYAVYLSDEIAIYRNSEGKECEGIVIMIITSTAMHKASQIDADKNFKLEEIHTYEFKKMPAWRIGGTIKKLKRGDKLYDSFLAPMLPDLDRAAREVSDLDAEVIQHIYSTMWYYSGQECGACAGTGMVKRPGGQTVCTKCDGQGVMAKSPYKDLVVKAPSADEKSVPTPPMGYVQKDVQIVKIQDERIKNHIYDALSAINMEFLANSPLNQSGTAKEVDRDELNNFVYSVAYHLVENVLLPAYKFIALMRYRTSVQNDEAIEKMIPHINVPQSFNLLTEKILEERLKSITESKAAPEIIKQVQLDFVNKTFADVPEIRNKVITTLTLDPFSNYSPDEKQNLGLTKMVRKEDIILSIYIASLVERAVQEDKKFLDLDYIKKKEKLMTYVDEIMADMEEDSLEAGAQGTLQIGAVVKVPAGKEKDPAHAGVNFTVDSINGDQVVLRGPDDEIVSGYTVTDFSTELAPAANE